MKKSILFVTLLLITMLRSAYASPAQNADIFTQSYMISSGLVDEGAAYIQHVDWSGDTCYAYLGDMSVYTYQPDEGLDILKMEYYMLFMISIYIMMDSRRANCLLLIFLAVSATPPVYLMSFRSAAMLPENYFAYKTMGRKSPYLLCMI